MVSLLVSCFYAEGARILSAEDRRPNILLILADDLGYSDLGCYGGEIATPNLDRLASNGLRFTQFYNTARCWPTRSALLTGYYAQQIRRDSLPGVVSGSRGQRPKWAKLLPEMLKGAGYRSYHTGKWHIDGMPIENGFDHSYYLKDQGRFFNPTKHWLDDKPLPPVPKGTDFYATTALADHAIEILTEHQRDYADRPFFYYLAFAAPHFPLHALPGDVASYDGIYEAGWDKIRSQRHRRQQRLGLFGESPISLSAPERDLGPPYHFPEAFEILGRGEVNRPLAWSELTEQQSGFQAKKMAIHAAMVDRMDQEIGRVFAQIEEMGQWENTLVLFLSDNGASAEIMVRDDGHDRAAAPGSADTYLCLGPGWSTTCNTPFRRHKTWTHEGGISTPLIAAWPAGIAARGEFRDQTGHVVDIVPTLLELSGAAGDQHVERPQPPGQSLMPIFAGRVQTGRDSIWWFHDGHRAIRRGDWKAVSPVGQPWELYDLSVDRDESTDLAVAHASQLQALVALWQEKHDTFVAQATADLSDDDRKRAQSQSGRSPTMRATQAAAAPVRRQVLLNADKFRLKDRHAFVMQPTDATSSQGQKDSQHAGDGKPWVFYAPCLNAYPDQAEHWMHEQLLDAGIAVAGIDVGEAYGSPAAFPFFDALYSEMQRRGYSSRPALLGRSRGGLWVSSWAAAHPERVAAIGGIYPVFDFLTYPGLQRAAPAYGLTVEELEQQAVRLNPIESGTKLADADIPIFIIHGTDDKVVPLDRNSAALQELYVQQGAADKIEVLAVAGQGHNFWPGFFHCQELVEFLITHASSSQQGAGKSHD